MPLPAPLLRSGLPPPLRAPPVARAWAARPELDVTALARPTAASRARLEATRSAPALRTLGTVASVDERYDVPSFVWATRPSRGAAPPPARAIALTDAEAAARSALAPPATLY